MARTVVGLDIGTFGVRAAEFKLGRRAPSLRKFATVPLPVGAIRAGVIADVPAVTEALRQLWSERKFSTKALRYQVADALPFPVDETNLDRYGWSWEDAERTKIVLGLPAAFSPGPQGPDTESHDHPAQQVISQQVAALAAEVRTTLDFFLGSDTEATTLSRVVLTGSCCNSSRGSRRTPGRLPRRLPRSSLRPPTSPNFSGRSPRQPRPRASQQGASPP